MINADLERFASSGNLGPFDSTSTRTQIQHLLGEPDADAYPDFATYGHVAFDLANSTGPPCRIQIAFPHASHMKPAHPSWTDWTPPTCFNDWPDKRIHWSLGRFTPGLAIEIAIQSFDDFGESDVLSSTNGLRILHNPNSYVDLLFEYDSGTGRVSLANMVAHPKPNAK